MSSGFDEIIERRQRKIAQMKAQITNLEARIQEDEKQLQYFLAKKQGN
jgi:hypothetical protein